MFAPAKVNLYLHVGPCGGNGRHGLDSLVVFAGSSAADRLSVRADETLSLSVSGPAAAGLQTGSDNLVISAARALAAAAGVATGAAFILEKHLPIAAGIGGGSADAGAALRLLSRLWGVDPGLARHVAPMLGGDVLAALGNVPCRMRGEGERVQAVPDLPPLAALLVNPGIVCPTGEVFARYDQLGGGQAFDDATRLPDFGRCERAARTFITWLGDRQNDLEDAASDLVPEIRETLVILADLPGARLSRMSGSGATCFALFDDLETARQSAAALSAAHPGWWVRATLLGAGA